MKNILLVNKPINWTSNDVCQKLKKALNLKKIGHAGTLDPKAQGLLVMGINEGTKFLNELIMQDKEYVAKIKFGVQTNTYDIEGDVINVSNEKIDWLKLKKIIYFYNNKIFYQQPPIFSALKIKGKKLYEYARKNQHIEIPKRIVSINSIKLLNLDLETNEIEIKLNVSKGFYVRSFANDLGLKINNYAHLTSLIRTKSGNFKLEDALDIEKIIDLHKKNILEL